MISIAALAEHSAAAPALVDAQGGLSYQELARRAQHRAENLYAAGVGAKSQAAWLAQPRRTAIIELVALFDLGATIIPTLDYPLPAALRAILPEAIEVSELGPPAYAAAYSPNPRAASVVIASSGATGTPKLALLPQAAWTAAAHLSAQHLGHSAVDRWLLSLPLNHVGGLSAVTRMLITGGSIALAESTPRQFAARPFTEAIAHTQSTLVSLVPFLLRRILEESTSSTNPELLTPLRAMRAILVGGAALPAQDKVRAQALALPILTSYGATETCAQVATELPNVATPLGAVGKLLPTIRARVKNGLLQFSGPTTMAGYLNSGPRVKSNAFVTTGDRGYVKNGWITVLGRADDVITTGGHSVDPRRVEDTLTALPAIREAAVVGLDDSEFGQIVGACLVTQRDRTRAKSLAKEMAAVLKAHERPRKIVMLSELPRLATGKTNLLRSKELLLSSGQKIVYRAA